MLELRRPSRLAAGMALAIVAVVEIQALAATFSAQSRLRGKVTRSIRASIDRARPRLEALLQTGGAAAWTNAIREARAASLASEAAVLDLEGRVLAADPPLAVSEPLAIEDLDLLGAGGSLTLGPILGESSRLVSYLGFRTAGGPVSLRLATPVPEIVEDLRERRPLFVAHGLALMLLAAAAALVLFPGAASSGSQASGTQAYEAAMARLHERSLRDQEQLQRVEEELRDKAALARSGELAAGIAHEMRNGLSTILGYARLVERGGADPAETARAIREECETLEAVIRRFIEFVKDEKLSAHRFDLARMLSRVVAREGRTRPGVSVKTDFGDGPIPFEGDEELLERAFENLIRNALEAAGTSGHVSVSVGSRENGALAVTVADDGPGLPQEVRENPRLFFSTKTHGLGLGLPIAVKIVRLHRGDLALVDRVPRGLAVTVRLPTVAPAA